ncbi:MAG: 50S ribosomal protein L4 [Nitrospina sp.]|nr:50S ribosomal protein L4 [Nitrospinota bacterium]TDJ49839.1 MAG: 50S ribosomal protein L4 [Nitrospina sp.]
MPELDLINLDKKKVGTVPLSPDVFDVKVREHLVKEYVSLQQANRRSGSASTKSCRGDLRGGGKKPWKQKGTGRARVGSIRSPLWRGGLTLFGPTPRSFGFKLSKKSKKIALKSVLTDRVRNNRLRVVETLTLEEPKTKAAVALLKKLELPERTLFVVAEKDNNLELAIRNLPNTDVLSVEGLNVFDLLVHETIVCTPESIKKIEERLN